MRVLIGPNEVAGLGAGWQAALQRCGVAADLVSGQAHPFAYSTTSNPLRVQRCWAALGRWRNATPRKRLAEKLLAVALHAAVGWLVLLSALPRYDAFVFLFGRTLTDSGLELRLLRWLGKRVVVVFQGADARPCYVDAAPFPPDRPFDAARAAAAAARQRRIVQRLERWAAAVVNARATAQFQRRPFVNWFALGIPRPAQPAPPRADDGEVVVLHSPSNPLLKGTAQIVAAVEGLRAKGLPVRLQTIHSRPNAEVLAALRDCDLVADQLYSDTPMAGFAAEAAGFGRPAVVGGCAAGRAAAQVAPAPLPPSLYVRPEAFADALEQLVRDGPRRATLGAAAADFVAREWSPEEVGRRLIALLQGDIPPAWWCRPDEVDHVAGCGLAEPVARERVAAVLREGGVAALQLDHNPTLRAAFVRFAEGGPA